MTTAVRAVGTKRPRGYVATAEEPSLPWAGRVPKPAMDADSFVDYGSGFLRKSCDSCVSSKRRCDGQDPCTRCLRRKKPCHYTERKKCGPRSGQKTTTKMRRLYTAETQLRRRYATETQLQQQIENRTPPSADAGMQQSMTLGAPPPRHATPTLSAGELSGETTCVDHTDLSDNGLPNQGLVRDESGSSWWSLDDQGAEGAASKRLNGACASGAPFSKEYRQHQQGSEKVCNRSDGVGGVGDEHYGCNGVEQGAGLWSGLHSSTAGAASGSGGSAGESWEDDESEEGLGQDEEEVAALLLGLGKANEEFEGFSDDDGSTGGDDDNIPVPHRPVDVGGANIFSKPPAHRLSVSNASQEWSV